MRLTWFGEAGRTPFFPIRMKFAGSALVAGPPIPGAPTRAALRKTTEHKPNKTRCLKFSPRVILAGSDILISMNWYRLNCAANWDKNTLNAEGAENAALYVVSLRVLRELSV